MPRIYVQFSGLGQIGTGCKTVASKVDTIETEFWRTIQELDWDVRYEADINSTAKQISRKLEKQAKALKAYQKFINDAYDEYVKLDEYRDIGLEESFLDSKNDGTNADVGKTNEVKQSDGERKSLADILKEIGKLLRTGGKISSNDELGLGSSVLDFISNIIKYLSNSHSPGDAFTDGTGAISSGLDAYNLFYEYLIKGDYGHDIEAKFGEGFAGLAMIGSGINFGLAGVESYKEYINWKNGNSSVYDFSSSAIDTAGEGVQFAGNTAMFYNWSKPGQVEILADGTVTSGMVKNTEYLKNGATYLRIADAGVTLVSTAVDSYGEYASDGTVDMGEWGAIGVESSLHALNKLNPVGFLVSDEAIDSAADFLLEDFGGAAANNLAQYDWYWKYASFEGNTFTNNVVTRGIAGVGATAVAMGETIYDGINYAFDAVTDAASDSARYVVDGIARLFK